jgi:uncharacterized protein involved in exopolysaccharide biosynthesis
MSNPFTAAPGYPPSRVRIFLPVFVLACAVSLAYVFARQPVYVGTARLQVESPKGQSQGEEADRLPNLIIATQVLTSGAVLDQIRSHLPPGQGGDALRGMLSATPVAGSNVLDLRAEGQDRDLLARLLGAWIEAYRRSQDDDLDRSSAAALEEARSAFVQLQQEVAVKRRDLEQFRRKHDIVSMEREENQAAARLRSLNEAINEARNREVNAEARLNAMRQGVATGRGAPGAAERSIVPDLERGAKDLREKMKDLEQEYTAQYLALDPKYKAMRANLARLEQQIEQEKRSSANKALLKEEQEVESARRAVTRLQEELSARKRTAQEFMARFSENTALANELTRVEEALETARARVEQIEKEKKAARPRLGVLSPPMVPDRPDRPDYWRDAFLAVAGAGALGILAVWFVEFFTRSGAPRPDPATQPVIHISYPPGAGFDPGMPAIAPQARPALGGSALRLPEAIVSSHSRELSGPEVRALWEAAMPEARVVIAGLLGGVSIDELSALRYAHVDTDACYVRVPGISGRCCTLRDPLRRLLIERRAAKGGDAPLADARGEPLAAAALEGLIACAAHDAGLAHAGEVTSETLRHTYFAYLVRQGARLAEIGEFIGRISPAAYREYGPLSPPGPGLPLEDIDPVFPALRDLRG